jgi:hypothetical protein
MDPDTWNTYHLMNNRARAVCLAARQAQFRALTEMTVNKLMTSAQGQLNAMSSLKVKTLKTITVYNSCSQKLYNTVYIMYSSTPFSQILLTQYHYCCVEPELKYSIKTIKSIAVSTSKN